MHGHTWPQLALAFTHTAVVHKQLASWGQGFGADRSGMPGSSRSSSSSTGFEGSSVAGHDWTGSAYLYNLDQLASGRPDCSSSRAANSAAPQQEQHLVRQPAAVRAGALQAEGTAPSSSREELDEGGGLRACASCDGSCSSAGAARPQSAHGRRPASARIRRSGAGDLQGRCALAVSVLLTGLPDAGHCHECCHIGCI